MGENPQKRVEDNASSLSKKFKSCVLCAGSGAGGLLLGHAGCIAAASATFLGAAAAGATITSLVIGGAGMAAGLCLWWKLGGSRAPCLGKVIVVGGAITGFALMNVFHAATSHHGHHNVTQNQDILSPQAKKWLETLKPEQREQIEMNAARQKISVARYVNQICGIADPAPK